MVFQVKVDPKKLNDFLEETSAGHGHRNRAPHREEAEPIPEDKTEVASTTQNWDGICLFSQDDSQPVASLK